MMHEPLPSLVIVWKPSEVARAFAPPHDEWSFAGCLRTTRPGERALIYQSGADGGVVGVYDFVSPAFPHRDLRWAAWGRNLVLADPVPRSALVAGSGALAATFGFIMGRKALRPEAARELIALVEWWPPFFSPSEPVPDPTDLVWRPAGSVSWGREAAMQLAIADHEEGWRRLGFAARPQLEVNPHQGNLDRIDLFGMGVIAECKMVVERNALDQLSRYLDALRRVRPGGDPHQGWIGHLVAAVGYSREAARQVLLRPDVRLWVCLPGAHDLPVLIEITEDRAFPEPPAYGAFSEPPADVADLLRDAVDAADELGRALGSLAEAATLKPAERARALDGDEDLIALCDQDEEQWAALPASLQAQAALADFVGAGYVALECCIILAEELGLSREHIHGLVGIDGAPGDAPDTESVSPRDGLEAVGEANAMQQQSFERLMRVLGLSDGEQERVNAEIDAALMERTAEAPAVPRPPLADELVSAFIAFKDLALRSALLGHMTGLSIDVVRGLMGWDQPLVAV